MKITCWLLMLVAMVSCKDKYVPEINVPPTGFLVVEGFINLAGSTTMMVSRASGIDSPKYIPEPGAELEIQSQNGVSYPLASITSGTYTSDNLFLDPSQQYRLHIRTSAGHDYISDFTSAIITPPIDSVNWTGNSSAVTIYVSTHDDHVQPGYYQWSFEETWKFTSAYDSRLVYSSTDGLSPRPDSEMIYTCWRSDVSTTIGIANTEKLTANVIYQYPLTQVPYNNTNKLVNRYSILVKQTEISQDWYEWTQKVKRNTEQLGSIFDAQPSQTGGNIHNTTDPTEPVIGFIGATTETQKRIFIDRIEIPPAQVFTGFAACQETISGLSPQDLKNQFADGFYIPVTIHYDMGFPTGVDNAEAGCVDCRLSNGTTVKPSFWQ